MILTACLATVTAVVFGVSIPPTLRMPELFTGEINVSPDWPPVRQRRQAQRAQEAQEAQAQQEAQLDQEEPEAQPQVPQETNKQKAKRLVKQLREEQLAEAEEIAAQHKSTLNQPSHPSRSSTSPNFRPVVKESKSDSLASSFGYHVPHGQLSFDNMTASNTLTKILSGSTNNSAFSLCPVDSPLSTMASRLDSPERKPRDYGYCDLVDVREYGDFSHFGEALIVPPTNH